MMLDNGEARVRQIATHVRGIMQALQLDVDDPNLSETPERVARLCVELCPAALSQPAPSLASFPNTDQYAQTVAVTSIPFYSLCPHHLLPFFGRAHVAYVPGQRLVGLGELARAVDVCSRGPRLQEQLGEAVVAYLERDLQPAGAMVVLRARHLCMEMRGQHTFGAQATTIAVRGVFGDGARRDEFLRGLPLE